VTGARSELPTELQQHLRTLRGITTTPVCVGFGIGTPAQAAAVGRAADGVIVGSAIVQLVEKHAGTADLVTTVGDFIASLKEPLRPARTAP
jgi:tryptophan synthase alpha chain